jgi:hypothetical protein
MTRWYPHVCWQYVLSLLFSSVCPCSDYDFNFDFHNAVEQLGEIIKLCLDCAKDPLLDTVGVLESN